MTKLTLPVATLLGLVISLVTGFAAEAQTSYDILRPKRSLLTAKIERIINVTNPALYPEVGTVGRISIDKSLKTISVSLAKRDLQDPTFAVPFVQLQLKLVSEVKNETCNSLTYIAVSKDGQNKVTVVDNTKNTCLAIIPFARTQIRLERSSLGTEIEDYTVDMPATELKREIAE